MNSGSFRVEVDPRAARDLKKLRHSYPDIYAKLAPLIDGLPANPLQGKRLKGEKRGCYSLRYRDYRIIYEVYTREKVIHLIRAGHRGDIYR